MGRLHVHISVDSWAQSIDLHNTLFGPTASVVKTDYAEWMLDGPRINEGQSSTLFKNRLFNTFYLPSEISS